MFHIEQSNIFEGLSSSLEGLNQQYVTSCAENCNGLVDFVLNNLPSSTFRCEEEAATGQVQLDSGARSPQVKAKNKRKRGRASKTREEVERQRMTHIAVERNRRMQMNQHLQILRSLMPNSYVQRGDQASIVGGAIDFVRELEDILQCLESVKMHHTRGVDRLHQEALISPSAPDDLTDQTAESKSILADVEVNLSGIFGWVKILSRRREGQVIKNIAAVEILQLQVLQTNITTIQEDVVCSFSVMMSAEAKLRAEDIANSVQQKLLSSNNVYYSLRPV